MAPDAQQSAPRSDGPLRPFAELDPSPDLPALERAVLERWDEEHTFFASMFQREGAPEFVFYDGPPFANGLPHLSLIHI